MNTGGGAASIYICVEKLYNVVNVSVFFKGNDKFGAT